MKIKKGMYYKPTRGLPSWYVPLQDLEKFVTIYAKGNKGIPLIWSKMAENYEKEGLDKVTSAKKAQEGWNSFCTACEDLSNTGKFPFVLVLKDLDLSRIKTDENLTIKTEEQDG